MRLNLKIGFLLTASCVLPRLTAFAEPAVPIDKLPFTIKRSGTYVLNRDLVAPSGSDVLVVAADNVTIDLRGHTLSTNVPLPANRANGIVVRNHSNVTIGNGRLRGFFRGIYLTASDQSGRAVHNMLNVIHDMQIQKCLYAGIKLDFGSQCTVTKCSVTETGGGPMSDAPCGIITLSGVSNSFVKNHVSSVYSRHGSIAFGIYGTGKGAVIADNQFVRCPYGISFPRDGNPDVRGNTFTAVGHKIDLWGSVSRE